MCNKAKWQKKEIFVLFFQILQILVIKSTYISKSWFLKKTLSSEIYLRSQKSHFQVFVFDLNSTRDFPILCKDFLKVSNIMDVSAKIKKRIRYWWRYTVYNFMDFSAMRIWKFFLMNCRFHVSLNIFWDSLLVSFMYVSLRPLSCTLLIKLFDCVEQYKQYIQTSWE